MEQGCRGTGLLFLHVDRLGIVTLRVFQLLGAIEKVVAAHMVYGYFLNGGIS